MGSKTFIYTQAIPAYGRGALAWECVEPIDEIFDAIERIDKESSKIRNSYKEYIGSLIDGEFDRLDKSATMHQTDTKQKEGKQ